jgi:vacuolar-type H+-ATPase subunit F/Vma7
MIAILGPQEKIRSFQFLGITPYPCDQNSAPKILETIIDKYQVIFYTQEVYWVLKPLLERYEKRALPCLALLPSMTEKITELKIRELIKKATGTDLLNK